MYISHQGLKAMHDYQVHQCLERAELSRKMPLKQERTETAVATMRRLLATLRDLTRTVRQAIVSF